MIIKSALNRLHQTVLGIVLITLSGIHVYADESQPEETAHEMAVVSVLIDNSLNGTLTAKRCDECELIQVKISPQVKYYTNRGQLVDLKLARQLTGKWATVKYKITTREATKIVNISFD